jgi:uncharacterized membrane protein
MKRFLLAAGLALSVLLGSTEPAQAHKDHKKKEAEAAALAAAQNQAAAHSGHVQDPVDSAVAARAGAPAALPTPAEAEAEAELPFLARSLDWAGRLHPFAVHFPIALFPVAWLALLFARRRGDTVSVIRSLIVVAGFASAAAALLGWPNTAGADAQGIFNAHRWLGTALGVAGLGMAVAALRSTTTAGSRPMLWALGLSTLAILVQGWLGAALVHGADHLAW